MPVSIAPLLARGGKASVCVTARARLDGAPARTTRLSGLDLRRNRVCDDTGRARGPRQQHAWERECPAGYREGSASGPTERSGASRMWMQECTSCHGV